ncbi:MAG: winged helix-turn-helix domain-containing protein [Candidatus Bathyarchaeota archaeon]|nr:winged helix-turn-helix domain-containing protein [Candidatus Bathyarchaeota archaeon]
MKNARRDKVIIYGDLLALLNEESKNEKILLTHVQVKLNVSFDRLKKYVNKLEDLGLIEDAASPRLTEKGRQYLKEYEKVLDFIKRMNLA